MGKLQGVNFEDMYFRDKSLCYNGTTLYYGAYDNFAVKSMAQHWTAISPVSQQWRYHSLALSHQNTMVQFVICMLLDFHEWMNEWLFHRSFPSLSQILKSFQMSRWAAVESGRRRLCQYQRVPRAAALRARLLYRPGHSLPLRLPARLARWSLRPAARGSHGYHEQGCLAYYSCVCAGVFGWVRQGPVSI